jgi:hypothetical protein
LKKSPQRNCGIRAVSSFCESRGIPYERRIRFCGFLG